MRNEARPLVGVNALRSLHRFNTVAWVTASSHESTPLIAEGSGTNKEWVRLNSRTRRIYRAWKAGGRLTLSNLVGIS